MVLFHSISSFFENHLFFTYDGRICRLLSTGKPSPVRTELIFCSP